ncbi:MAG: hypothetical protein HQ594_01945 [Candidatus Omnitrophica bacterium]|nr:hypothetical protein [Candidatus Omnitrophota bacterium]
MRSLVPIIENRIKRLVPIIIIAILLFLFLVDFLFAMEITPHNINDMDTLMRWLNADFEYALKIPDNPQNVEEMMDKKTGDCDDFARVVSHFLSEWGTSSDVIIVKFKDLGIAHALCIWKDANGTYNFSSNRKVVHTGRSEVTEAIEYYYPDWDQIVYVNEDLKEMKKIRR